MPDRKLAELRRLAGPDYVVFRRDKYEKAKQELREAVYGKGVDTIHKKRKETS